MAGKDPVQRAGTREVPRIFEVGPARRGAGQDGRGRYIHVVGLPTERISPQLGTSPRPFPHLRSPRVAGAGDLGGSRGARDGSPLGPCSGRARARAMTSPPGVLDQDALRRRHYNATIVGERIHHGTVMVIRVLPDTPIRVPKPGQWLELGLGVWESVQEGAESGSVRRLLPDAMIRRAYSLSSPILSSDHSRL